nr:MAG TPA: hypothetical protein [Caudoviricetes sp.]
MLNFLLLDSERLAIRLRYPHAALGLLRSFVKAAEIFGAGWWVFTTARSQRQFSSAISPYRQNTSSLPIYRQNTPFLPYIARTHRFCL